MFSPEEDKFKKYMSSKSTFAPEEAGSGSPMPAANTAQKAGGGGLLSTTPTAGQAKMGAGLAAAGGALAGGGEGMGWLSGALTGAGTGAQIGGPLGAAVGTGVGLVAGIAGDKAKKKARERKQLLESMKIEAEGRREAARMLVQGSQSAINQQLAGYGRALS